MRLLGCIIGALVGGAVGAAIWAAIGHFAHREVGWIAWGIGGLAGLGAAIGRGGAPGGVVTGVIAAVVAAVAIVVGKFAVVHFAMAGALEKARQNFEAEIRSHQAAPAYYVVGIAHDVADERAAEGKPVQWPPGVDPAEADQPQQFPPELWKDAQARWDGLSSERRTQYMNEVDNADRALFDQFVKAQAPELESQAFADSFTLFDLLWAFLALGTAFKLGAGGRDDEKPAGGASGARPA